MSCRTHVHVKACTAEVHQRLHAHPMLLPLANGTVTLTHYFDVLECFYTYYQALSRALIRDRECLDTRGSDILEHDLQCLEKDLKWAPQPRPAVSQPTLPFAVSEQDQWYGLHYVIMGSRLGGQVIAKQVDKKLHLTPATGLSFFYGRGKDTARHWHGFVQDLACHVVDDHKCAQAALNVFTGLENYLWQAHRQATASHILRVT